MPAVNPSSSPFVGGQPNMAGAQSMSGQTHTGPVMTPATQIPGMSATPNTPAVPSIPGTPGGAAPTAPTAPGARPESGTAPITRMGGNMGRGGATPFSGFNYSAGRAIGAGMWTPGGTAEPTVSAGVQGAHGLLEYRDAGINPAQSAAKQSAALANETKMAQQKMSQFSARAP